MFARLVYFLAIGWWLGLFAVVLAVAFTFTIVLAPLGLTLFNRLPRIVFLREPVEWELHGEEAPPRLPFLLRAIWFVFIGLPIGMLAFSLGYALAFTLVGIPLAVLLFDRVPLLLTLNRSYA